VTICAARGSVRRRLLARVPRRDDSGASAVEFALVSLLLFTLVFGIIEFSLLMRDYVSIGSAVRTAARIASAEAGAGPATCPTATGTWTPPPCLTGSAPKLAQDAADAIQRSGLAMPKDSIDELWVFKAGPSGYPGNATSMPATCTTDCVRFKWVDATDRFTYQSGTWYSTSIAACTGTNTNGSPKSDAVGVYIKATHTFIVRLFGTSREMGDRAVMQFEPLPNDQCQANKAIGSGGHA
jgi:hypothetical protein